MANAKKSVQKSKQSSKVTAKRNESKAKTTKKSSSKAAPVAYTGDERRRLLKFRTQSDDIIAQAVRVWSTRTDVKVLGLTPARLRSLLARAVKAELKEQTVREAMEAKLRPLQDARLRAEDEAFRALLDLHAQIKSSARRDPALTDLFAFLAAHLTGSREDTEPTPEPTPPAT